MQQQREPARAFHDGADPTAGTPRTRSGTPYSPRCSRCPGALRRPLAWDQGKELALHTEIAAALNMPVFFCDPHSPWQRGTNENTNGLLRQYFPKGSDLRVYTATDLAAVAAELNARPRKTLDWDTPAQRLSPFRPVPSGKR